MQHRTIYSLYTRYARVLLQLCML